MIQEKEEGHKERAVESQGLIESCVKCGTCVPVCPVFEVTGRESYAARGRHHLMGRPEAERTAVYEDIFSKCLLCGACVDVCPAGLETPNLVVAARSNFSHYTGQSFLKYLARKTVASPTLLAGLRTLERLVLRHLPEESGLRLRLRPLARELSQPPAAGYLAGLKTPGADSPAPACSYFVGCLANHLNPEIGAATGQLAVMLTGASPAVPVGQSCCGLATLAAGNPREARRQARRNIAAFADNQLPVITSCASCYAHLSTYPDLLADDPDWRNKAVDFAGRLQEFSTFFSGLPEKLPAPADQSAPEQRVFYHDPCHLRFRLKITEAPRNLLKSMPQVTLVELPDGPRCCGQGGLFHLAHPDLSQKIRDRLLADFAGLDAATVVTTCTGCLLQWRQGLAAAAPSVRVVHLAVLLQEFCR